jgi:uncharacterized protein YggE
MVKPITVGHANITFSFFQHQILMKCDRFVCRGSWVNPCVGVLGLTLFIGAALPVLSQPRPLPTSEVQYRILTVTGQGVENVQTTQAEVRLGVDVQGKTAEVVQQEVAQRSAAVVSLLKSRNVEKLETSGITLNPDYTYNNNKQELIGYRGSNIVSFRIDTSKAGSLLDDAVKAGASRIDSVSFVAAEEAIAAAQKQALVKATKDAQDQAKVVLSALNLSPQDVVSIQIGANTPPPPPIPLQAKALSAEADATTPIVGGEQAVQASVTLQIRY